MKIRCFRDELQTSFDFIDSRRSQPTQPLSFNRHYIFVPFSNGIPVDSENIKLWNISYVKLEPWSMLHLTKNQLEKKLIAQKLWKRNCSSKLSLFALLLYSMNMTKYYTDFNMSLLVPIQLLQFLVTLWRDTQHSPELPAVTTSDHTDFTSFILVASKSKQVQNPIKYLFENYKFITTILITIVQQDCLTWCRDTSTWALSMAPVFILKTNCQNFPSNVTIDHF